MNRTSADQTITIGVPPPAVNHPAVEVPDPYELPEPRYKMLHLLCPHCNGKVTATAKVIDGLLSRVEVVLDE